jgi:hypothetical protein
VSPRKTWCNEQPLNKRTHLFWRLRDPVRYGTRLGDLKENWFLLFQLNTQHTPKERVENGSKDEKLKISGQFALCTIIYPTVQIETISLHGLGDLQGQGEKAARVPKLTGPRVAPVECSRVRACSQSHGGSRRVPVMHHLPSSWSLHVCLPAGGQHTSTRRSPLLL